ncbi:hypothetical protein RIVM261_034330 [Rivularia sp. IAM M-261]|nr:hypothetical protein RIVM261_034330 [Rivularia sp. IAM M-261]
MKIKPKILCVTCLVLLAPHLKASAQKPNIADSQILPYIIDSPNSTNSVIRIRCLYRNRQNLIRNRLLKTPNQENYITIEIEGSCHNVNIRLPNNSYTDYKPLQGDYWLYREGSGWNWLKSH